MLPFTPVSYYFQKTKDLNFIKQYYSLLLFIFYFLCFCIRATVSTKFFSRFTRSSRLNPEFPFVLRHHDGPGAAAAGHVRRAGAPRRWLRRRARGPTVLRHIRGPAKTPEPGAGRASGLHIRSAVHQRRAPSQVYAATGASEERRREGRARERHRQRHHAADGDGRHRVRGVARGRT